MKILIVEDLEVKIEELSNYLSSLIPNVMLTVRKSYQSGLEEIVENHHNYDLILLDMSMQNYDTSKDESGGDPINEVGLHILDHMYFKDIQNKVIVVTMYANFGHDNYNLEDLNSRLYADFPDNYLGCVFFNATDGKWKEDIKTLITANFTLND